MAKRYEVHGFHATKMQVRAKDADGNEVVGLAPVVIVELVPLDAVSGSIREVIRTPTPELAKVAQELFEVGAVVEHGGWTQVQTAAEREAAKIAANEKEKSQ